MIIPLNRIAMRSLLLAFAFAPSVFAVDAAVNTAAPAAPPGRANQQVSTPGFSTWDVQFLYGTTFHEPGIYENIEKNTVTLENSSGWSWGSSYFFIDYLRSNHDEDFSTEFYGEWYPSISLGKIVGLDDLFPRRPLLKDLSVTMGFNAGSKNTGASPFVVLPGFTFDLEIPGFQFFSLGTYAYMDSGRFGRAPNGCNATTYQITPSWSLPFNIGSARFRFDGFIDFIGPHGECSSQIVSQPTLKLDIGGTFGHKPDKLLAGVECGYMKNKYGISELDQTATQAVVMWVF